MSRQLSTVPYLRSVDKLCPLLQKTVPALRTAFWLTRAFACVLVLLPDKWPWSLVWEQDNMSVDAYKITKWRPTQWTAAILEYCKWLLLIRVNLRMPWTSSSFVANWGGVWKQGYNIDFMSLRDATHCCLLSTVSLGLFDNLPFKSGWTYWWKLDFAVQRGC